ncbi:MAG: DNA-binding protein [Gemmatimonadetes bacterium]|nr:DNA-binding protein [Gemmatimonadota bacterium]
MAPEPASVGRARRLVRAALAAAGYERLEQFVAVTEADLLQLHGIGPKAVATIREALDRRGLTFACRR